MSTGTATVKKPTKSRAKKTPKAEPPRPRLLRPVSEPLPPQPIAEAPRPDPAPTTEPEGIVDASMTPDAPEAPAPAPPKPDPDMLMGLLDGPGVIERTLFVTASALFQGEQGALGLFAARLAGMVAYAATEQLAGNGAPLTALGKHVRSAGNATGLQAPPPQWDMCTLVAQTVALTVAGCASHLARAVSVSPPADTPVAP